jgi:tRNA-dihydrouridine synthase 3
VSDDFTPRILLLGILNPPYRLLKRYILKDNSAPPAPNDDAAEALTNPASSTRPRVDDRDTYHDSKRQRTAGGSGKKMSKEEKKARSGSNKSRRFKALHDEINICWSYAGGMGCFKGDE